MHVIKSIGSLSSICESHIHKDRLTDGKKTLTQLLREEREELFGEKSRKFRCISEVMPISIKPNKQDRRPLRYKAITHALESIIAQIPSVCDIRLGSLFVPQTYHDRYWVAVTAYILHECYIVPNLQIRSFLPIKYDVVRLVRKVILPLFKLQKNSSLDIIIANGLVAGIDYECQFYDMFDYFMRLNGRDYA
jgi:hypothetical protein